MMMLVHTMKARGTDQSPRIRAKSLKDAGMRDNRDFSKSAQETYHD